MVLGQLFTRCLSHLQKICAAVSHDDSDREEGDGEPVVVGQRLCPLQYVPVSALYC